MTKAQQFANNADFFKGEEVLTGWALRAMANEAGFNDSFIVDSYDQEHERIVFDDDSQLDIAIDANSSRWVVYVGWSDELRESEDAAVSKIEKEGAQIDAQWEEDYENGEDWV